MAERYEETRDVWELAGCIGADLEQERVRWLLRRPVLRGPETAELLCRSRQTVQAQFDAGNVPGARSEPYGDRRTWEIHPRDLLAWAVRRRRSNRYIDRDRAQRWAAEHGRVFGEEHIPPRRVGEKEA